jgi:hypothetical protein
MDHNKGIDLNALGIPNLAQTLGNAGQQPQAHAQAANNAN